MSYQNQAPPTEILLVEDNPGYVRLMMEALKDGMLIVWLG